jgi:hypothetical protein
MRCAWLALFCFGAAAFSQSPAPQKIDPDQLFRLPENFVQHAPDFKTLKRLPPMGNHEILGPRAVIPRRDLNSSQIDPRMIIRPPWRSQTRGRDVASRIYPNLKFLPIRPTGRSDRIAP